MSERFRKQVCLRTNFFDRKPKGDFVPVGQKAVKKNSKETAENVAVRIAVCTTARRGTIVL